MYYSLKIGMFILNAVTYASSLSKAVFNFQKPLQVLCFGLGDWAGSQVTQRSDQTRVHTRCHISLLIELTSEKLRKNLGDIEFYTI